MDYIRGEKVSWGLGEDFLYGNVFVGHVLCYIKVVVRDYYV